MLEATALVLVAVVKTPRDLELARVLGWYRIPARTAPKVLNVDWLAFYQTAAGGAEKWSINYLAPVRGHELTTRGDLLRAEPNHPRAAEPYFKLQLGPLERLPRPIPSRRWRRLTFLYTTGARLLAAAEINDLIVETEERELLWRALRDRGLNAERQYQISRGRAFDLAVLCALGNLAVTLGPEPGPAAPGWHHLNFRPETVAADLPVVLSQIDRLVQDLGGPRSLD